jgi:membrane-associated phospholipid phosphatase
MDRRPGIALLGALACAAALILTWILAFRVGFGHQVDAATLQGFMGLLSPEVARIANHVGTLVNPGPFVVLGAIVTAVAVLRGRPRTALVVPVVLVGANATSQWLKPMLAQQRFADGLGADQIAPASWPSGHATAAMSLALCAVLVSSARWRPAIATLGAAFAVAVSYSILALAWHFPSDILGGFLVATGWTFLGVAALWAAAARWPARTGRAAVVRARDTVAPSGVAVVAAAACAGAVALARPAATLAYAQAHTTFVVGAAALAAASCALAVGVALALRR